MAILRTTPGGRPSVKLERTLAHPPEKVWRAVTSPEELAHWFPAAVTLPDDLSPGGKITFTFTETGDTSEGEIVGYRPPEVFEFTWNSDLIRIEVSADGAGSKLAFTHVFNRGEPDIALLGAGRHVTGWVACLDSLEATLDGRTPELPTDWHARMLATSRNSAWRTAKSWTAGCCGSAATWCGRRPRTSGSGCPSRKTGRRCWSRGRRRCWPTPGCTTENRPGASGGR
ncbi:SRPBCC family protein [Amycolatopsis silviterrae]|uniref:SRPBCC family protein n=1 Tax=Amycolatopsis silviterrae TaxID=1656914 RepID=A0ABW5H0Z9_9PSEU